MTSAHRSTEESDMITRSVSTALAMGLLAVGCTPEPPPQPEPIIQVDTVVVTREVEVPPPLPEGRATTVCLATGQTVEIRISAQGDTLVGPQRARLDDLRPILGFTGNYAAATAWFVNDEAISMDRRQFQKFGTPMAKQCKELKIVGEHMGVNLFADVSAASPFDLLYVPVAPNVFQPYQAQVGRVRG
jgi:hypothetical protein